MRWVLTFAVWLLSAAVFLLCGSSSFRIALAPGTPVDRSGEAGLSHSEETSNTQTSESASAPLSETPADPVDDSRITGKREALTRMLECLRGADPQFLWSSENEEWYVQTMHLGTEKHREVWWNSIGSSRIKVDAESGTLLELRGDWLRPHLPPIGSLARQRLLEEAGVTRTLAELRARDFIATAYPEFHSRPFQWEGTSSMSSTHGSDYWIVRFQENHGGDISRYQNWIAVQIDAFTGKVTDCTATYVRAETEPLRYGSQMATRIALQHWQSTQEDLAIDSSELKVELFVEPVSKDLARALWEVASRDHHSYVNAFTGELDIDDAAWRKIAEKAPRYGLGF